MKKSKLFSSIVLLSTCAIMACSCNRVTPDPEPEPELTIEKTKMAYTYMDVSKNYYTQFNVIPNIGEPELLILPIYFEDSSDFIPVDKKEIVKNDIEKAFFGTKDDVGFESVSSYYSKLSFGACNLKGTVSDWISVDTSYSEYGTNESKTINLVSQVVNKYFSTTNDSRKKYDLDGNGFLDGVVVIYGAPDSDNVRGGSDLTNLWAYTNWDIYSSSDVDNPTLCNFFWASFDFMYSRSVAQSKIGQRIGSGDTNDLLPIDTHVYIHEIGHMFGLVDYYDYSYQFSPAGGFSMQDFNVGCHDPYSVMALGWCDPYIPTESCTITLNKFQSNREVILLTNEWNDINSPFDEYLLVEFYSLDGLNEFDSTNQYFKSNPMKRRPTGPNACGIRLWHVDARLLANPSLRDVSKITVDPNANGKVMHAMSNTYSGGSNSKSYTTYLGSSYANFNVLQLIRNEETETYQSHNFFDNYSLFKDGSKFSMNTFGKQFVNKGRLNTNKVLGWNFSVKIEGEQAKISLTRTI